jgi:hypothetical protein
MIIIRADRSAGISTSFIDILADTMSMIGTSTADLKECWLKGVIGSGWCLSEGTRFRLLKCFRLVCDTKERAN